MSKERLRQKLLSLLTQGVAIAMLVDKSIDWDDVDSRLDQQRELARQFLHVALGD